ncbi:MAG: hypothetical protein ACM3S5_10215 [Rhodospirillales bacterium]
MTAASIPVQDIASAGLFGSSLRCYPNRPSWLRRALELYFLPRTTRFINRALSGERTGSLSRAEAEHLYRAIEPLYRELVRLISGFGDRPVLERLLFTWWIRRLEPETEKLGDILETLAWGCDQDLRDYIDHSLDSRKYGPALCQRS